VHGRCQLFSRWQFAIAHQAGSFQWLMVPNSYRLPACWHVFTSAMKADTFTRPDEVAGFDYVELTVRTVGDDERLMPGTGRSSTSSVGGCSRAGEKDDRLHLVTMRRLAVVSQAPPWLRLSLDHDDAHF
jgi:hypothetical protein